MEEEEDDFERYLDQRNAEFSKKPKFNAHNKYLEELRQQEQEAIEAAEAARLLDEADF